MLSMKIDVHTHIFHNKIAEKACSQLIKHYGHPIFGNGTAGMLLELMDKSGIDKAFVHTAATSPEQVIPANTWTITLNKN